MSAALKWAVVGAWLVAAFLTGQLTLMMATGEGATLDWIFALVAGGVTVWCVISAVRELRRAPEPIFAPATAAQSPWADYPPGVFGPDDLAAVARAIAALEKGGALTPGEVTAEALCHRLSQEGEDGPYDPIMVLIGLALVADDRQAPLSGIACLLDQVEMDEAVITACVFDLFRIAGRPLAEGDVTMDLPRKTDQPFDMVITLDGRQHRIPCTFFFKYLPENLLMDVLILADQSGPHTLRQASLDQWVVVSSIEDAGLPAD